MLAQLLALETEQTTVSTTHADLLSQLLVLGRDQIANSNNHTEALSRIQAMAIEQAASLHLWKTELRLLRPNIGGITLVDAVGDRRLVIVSPSPHATGASGG